MGHPLSESWTASGVEIGRSSDQQMRPTQGEVEEIDLTCKLVSTGSARFSHDYLVVFGGTRYLLDSGDPYMLWSDMMRFL